MTVVTLIIDTRQILDCILQIFLNTFVRCYYLIVVCNRVLHFANLIIAVNYWNKVNFLHNFCCLTEERDKDILCVHKRDYTLINMSQCNMIKNIKSWFEAIGFKRISNNIPKDCELRSIVGVPSKGNCGRNRKRWPYFRNSTNKTKIEK